MATQLYTGPITVSVSQTIKAVALAPGKTVSNELVAAYVISANGAQIAIYKDSSSNSISSVVLGSPNPVSSPLGTSFGNALTFSGTDSGVNTDGISTGPGNFYSLSPAGSMELTISRARSGLVEKVCGQWTADISTENSLLYFTSDNKLNYATYVGSTFTNISSSVVISDTLPHQVQVSFDGTTLRLFVDGSVVGSMVTGGNPNIVSNVPFYVGRGDTTSDAFNGTVDEIRFSSVARNTTAYVPSSSPFVYDSNTIILLHLDAQILASGVFIRDQTTPVLLKGVMYGGWLADAIAAPSACWDGTRFVMTVSLWNALLGKWASAFFTSADLKIWTYVTGSLRTPSVGNYIIGNGGISWFGGKYIFAYTQYASGGFPAGVNVDSSTDLVTWTNLVTNGIDSFGGDPSLVINPSTSKLESWYLDSNRIISYSDTTDGTTWTSRGEQVLPYFNTIGSGEPQAFYNGIKRYLTIDGGVSSGARNVQGMVGVSTLGTYAPMAQVLTAGANSWESTQVFDFSCIGIFDIGDGKGPVFWGLYAGGDNNSTTDATDSSIGLAYMQP